MKTLTTATLFFLLISFLSFADIPTSYKVVVSGGGEGGTSTAQGTPFSAYILRWSSYSSIPWRYNLYCLVKHDSNETDNDFFNAIDAAFDNWQNETNVSFAPPVSATTSTIGSGDGYNTVLFVYDDHTIWDVWGDGIAVTLHTHSTVDNYTRIETDIYLNNNGTEYSDYSWTTDPDEADESSKIYYVERIMTHEIGHLLSLSDPSGGSIPNSIMDPTSNPSYNSTEIGTVDVNMYNFIVNGVLNDNYSESDGINYYLRQSLTISSNCTLTLDNQLQNFNFNIAEDKQITLNGKLKTQQGCTFTRWSASDWSGIVINNGGTFEVTGGDATIERATTGIRINAGGTLDNLDGSTYRKLTIQNCGTGLRVYNTSPTIRKILLTGNSSQVTLHGGIAADGTSAAPTFSYSTMQSNSRGAYFYNSDGSMEKVFIDSSNTGHSIHLEGASGSLALEDSSYIAPDTANGKKAIFQDSNSTDIYAYRNYWGTDSPTSSLFDVTGTVYYSPYLTSSDMSGFTYGAKPVVLSPTSYEIAKEFEREGRLDQAFEAYREAVPESDDKVIKRRSIKKMIYLASQIGKGYEEVRSAINNELIDADVQYAAILDYLLTDITFCEGDYSGAVSELTHKAESYKNTWMECEMLTFAAVISGDYLGNKEQARTLADQAAKINPGYGSLDIAYNASGVKYNPSEHTNTFADGSGAIEKKAFPLEDPFTEETLTPSVTISPNPANPATTISYTIAKSARVNLDIYSINGQKVATLVDRNMPAGRHSVVFDSSSLASGVYFYRLETSGFAKTGKMLLVK